MSKIRLTGGEPTLRSDIVPLTAALRALPGVEAVGMTTNALALKRKLADLQAAGAVCRLAGALGVVWEMTPPASDPQSGFRSRIESVFGSYPPSFSELRKCYV